MQTKMEVDYTPVYMLDRGSQYKENRYKILDMKKEIALYDTEESNIDKSTYDKLVRGVDRLNSIIQKHEENQRMKEVKYECRFCFIGMQQELS